jgi:two-component system, OmpR family, phosphate regulon sensor histidine kinase PhoR
VHRRLVIFALVAAVLIAALGLTYYSYRNTPSERLVVLDTMRALAGEKIIGIQTEIMNAANAMFDRVDLDDLDSLGTQLKQSTLFSVVVLDLDKQVVVGSWFTKRGPAEDDSFRRLFVEQIVPDLDLDGVLLEERRTLHKYYDGKTHLFAYTRRLSKGKTFFVVVETDMIFLVGKVMQQFFDPSGMSGRHVYQVIDRSGELVYGFRFSGEDVVELPFRDILTQWRLRVFPREASLLAAAASRRATLDLILIGTSAAVILGGLLFMLVTVRRERRLNELKSEFISNVSHELKTPLSIISMFGELLAMGRTRSPAQATEYAEIIRRESVRLSRLIDSVLDFAKIERGVDVYEFADEQDLGEVVRRALDLSRHRIEQSRMELTTDVAADLPHLRIDTNAMTVAVLNLVDNAVKYAADGKRIEVRLRPADDGVELEVRDFGPGVPADEREAIFERFYRSRTVRLKPIRGSGIGLALVKHIADAHGGEIGVREGEGGAGAVFRLWIPTETGA